MVTDDTTNLGVAAPQGGLALDALRDRDLIVDPIAAAPLNLQVARLVEGVALSLPDPRVLLTDPRSRRISQE